MNRNVILVSGKSASGKSASLRGLRDPEGVIYLCTESGKELPFSSKFRSANIVDPMQVFKAFEEADKINAHTIIIDTATYLMDMYESVYVLPSSDGRKAWSYYAQYWKRLMQQYVAQAKQNVVILAHTSDVYNESELIMETMVKVKGSLMNQGIESYFGQVISTKKLPVSRLTDIHNDLLEITEDDELVGVKYVFQTRLTKDTVNERIRGPLGLWSKEEVFIDNDLQKVLDRLHAYYT